MIDEYGERIEGRPTIQDFYSALFAARKGATIEISDGVAAVSGTGRRQGNGPDPGPANGQRAGNISRLYGRICEAGWAMAALERSRRTPGRTGPHERLKELEWMVGDWLDESSESIIHATCRWSEDKNFLLRDFEIRSRASR